MSSRHAARRTHGLPLLGLLSLFACSDPDTDTATPSPGAEAPADESARPWFEEVAAPRGIDFQHTSGARPERYLMPETITGGGALLDLDGDGDLDAYLVQGGDAAGPRDERPGNRLYANRGDGHFQDVTADSGADDRGYGMGVAAGDVDGDGDLDLYVTNLDADTLLRNEGQLAFTDVGAEAGTRSSGWSTSASFFDADRDGDLDLYVTAYLDWSPAAEIPCTNRLGSPDYCSPKTYTASAPDSFFRNDGAGTFADESEPTGLRVKRGNGLGVGCGDFDADGWIDVFVANDGDPDFLWRNLEGARFEEIGETAGCATSADGVNKAGMGVALADIDEDLDLDVLVCNLGSETDSLHLNEGGFFREGAARAGLASSSKAFTRFGMGLFDFDHDGRLDLFQANGRVERQGRAYGADPYAEPNLLLRGIAGPRFEPVGTADGTASPRHHASRAAVFGDVDGDGAVDVLVVNRDGPVELLRNLAARSAGRAEDYVALDVREADGAPALGAVVFARAGDRDLRRTVRSDASYLAANSPRVHVGLGSADGLRSVRVRFVDGVEQEFPDLARGRSHVLTRR